MSNKLINEIEKEFGVELGIIKRINIVQHIVSRVFFVCMGALFGAVACALFLISVTMPRDYKDYTNIKSLCREAGYTNFKSCIKQLQEKETEKVKGDLV